MGSLCGSSTNTTVQSNSPPPQVLANYQALVDRANAVASQPYQAYPGSIYQPMTAQTNAGITSLDAAGNSYQPFLGAAANYAQAGAAPVAGNVQGLSAAYANPYANAGAQYGQASGQNIANYGTQAAAAAPQFQSFQQGIQAYSSPYTQDVINATMAQMQHQQGVAQTGGLATAIKSGNAFGGDRMGVAAAEMERGHDANRASTIANLNNQGFQQAVNQYNQNQAQAFQGANLGLGAMTQGAALGMQGLGMGMQGYGQSQTLAANMLNADANRQQNAATQFGQLGQQAQSQALSAAQANIAGGQLTQQDLQNILNANQSQWQAQQQFPYQQTSWLGNLVLGTGSQSGGTGSTTTPGSSPLAQGIGLGATALGAAGMAGGSAGLAGLAAFLKTGGRAKFAQGGGIGPYQTPIDFSTGPSVVRNYVPDVAPMQIRGGGPPHAPNAAADPNAGALKQGIGALSGLKGLGGARPTNLVPAGLGFSPSPIGETLPIGMTPSAASTGLGMNGLYADGGFVPGFGVFAGQYADGGMPDDPDAEPFRMPGQEAMDAWRASTDFLANHKDAPEPAMAYAPPATVSGVPVPRPKPQGLGVLASNGPSPLDNAQWPAGPVGAPSAAPAQTALAYDGAQQPTPAGLAAIQAATQGNGAPVEKPNGWQALMMAGLGMMASRNPSALGAIGEGGLAGLNNYAQQQKAYNDLDKHPVIDSSGPTTRIYYPSTKQWIDTGVPTISAAQQAANERIKAESERSAKFQDRQQTETERYHRATEENKEVPTGYRKKDDGSLEAVPGGPADPTTVKATADAKRGTAGLLDDDTISDMAGQYLAGDKSVMQNLGRGAQGAENIVKLRAEITRQAREAGLKPDQIATKMADFAGRTAAMRSLGTRGANVEYAANTANKAIDLAEEAYGKLPRGQFVPLNQLREIYDKKTSTPEQAAAYAAVNTLVNEYARVAAGGSNQATEGMRQHAREMLNTAMGPEAFNAVLKMMRREIQTAKAAYKETRQEFLSDHSEAKPDAAKTTAPPAAAAPAATQPPANPKVGDRFLFKQGWGAWDGSKWVPVQ